MNSSKRQIKKIVSKILLEEEESLLVHPIDHSKAVGSDPVTDEPEVIDHSTGKVVKISDRVVSLSETRLRNLVRNLLRKTRR